MTTSPTVEERLTRVLGAWAAGSLVAGGLLARRPATRGLGRQTAAWGAVDGAIALVGARQRRRRGPTDPARLRTVLRVNLAADVGYVLAGLAARRSERWRGDGTAVVVQGLFLLALDGWAERALSRGPSAGG